MPVFLCEHVTKAYRDADTIRDVSLSLEKGEMLSLLGTSGVGKTTLFNILAGVDVPDRGRVVLGGEDITGVAGRVSYMLQKDLLFPYKTIIDNVSLPLILRGVPKKEARAQAAELFVPFGLSGYENAYPAQLSGGMRQRAALLRTCLTGNGVVLLDEPFSALDALTKRAMHAWYLDIVTEMGLSTVFITHDVDEALMLSDRVCVMTGPPGTITVEVEILPKRPRDADFSTSDAFMGYKRSILEAIGM